MYDLDKIETALSGIEKEVGRRALRKHQKKRAPLGETARSLVRREYTKDRAFLLSLGYWWPSKETGLNRRHTFVAEPQIPFRGRRLVFWEYGPSAMPGGGGILFSWQLIDVTVAKKSQFVQGSMQGFPLSVFGANASQVNQKFDTASPGEEIAVIIDTVDNTFFGPSSVSLITAGMVGHAADK